MSKFQINERVFFKGEVLSVDVIFKNIDGKDVYKLSNRKGALEHQLKKANLYRAIVIDLDTKKATSIQSEYPSPQAFKKDLHANNYHVISIKLDSYYTDRGL